MRHTLARLVVFVALLMMLDRLVYAGAVFLRDHSGHPAEIDLIYDEGGWNPPVVFFGDSRTRHNFDMSEVENLTGLRAYDFGHDGASAEQNLFMLEEYLHNHHPIVVVFEADPQFLDKSYGQFFRGEFRDHVAVVPDASELLRQSPQHCSIAPAPSPSLGSRKAQRFRTGCRTYGTGGDCKARQAHRKRFFIRAGRRKGMCCAGTTMALIISS